MERPRTEHSPERRAELAALSERGTYRPPPPERMVPVIPEGGGSVPPGGGN